jgi:hypothetical protein
MTAEKISWLEPQYITKESLPLIKKVGFWDDNRRFTEAPTVKERNSGYLVSLLGETYRISYWDLRHRLTDLDKAGEL